MILEPSNKEVKRYLKIWDSLENYVLQERSLNRLFIESFPDNVEIEDILIKASTLNDFYSTNIMSIFPVAKHIQELDIDARLRKGDLTLISDIAHVTIKEKEFCFYSFATKYCSHHFQEQFPIYDSYVEDILWFFKKRDSFGTFKKADLRDYLKFTDILKTFSDFYGIDQYGFKDLDRYLWQLGKDAVKEGIIKR